VAGDDSVFALAFRSRGVKFSLPAVLFFARENFAHSGLAVFLPPMNAPQKTIVVIDDDPNVQLTLGAFLERHGYTVRTGASAAQGEKRINAEHPDLVLLDLGLPDADGLDVLRSIKAAHPALPVMVLSAHDSLANAIESIKLGAFHFLSKPFAPEELLSLCTRALEQTALAREANDLRAEKAHLQQRLRAAEELLAPVAVSRRMREIEQIIARVAPSEANVLFTGESGVGKEVYAGELHRQSARAGLPMVKLNCAAFPANMIEAELFGYAKGAFTGALAAFPGMLAQAHGGTLFLDEIVDMPVDLQTRFLRVLQEREYRPLGTAKNLPADFRLISACNRPPAHAVRDGLLRQDLYFRLKTFEIEIPPLRERRDDIAKLTDIFLGRFARQQGKPIPKVEPEVLELFRVYPWPGNVRELQNAIEHALVLCDGQTLGPQQLPQEIRLPHLAPASLAANSAAIPTLEEMEKRTLVDALQRAGGNKSRAAAALGIHRPTLYAKLRRLGITS
jgi:DNA-binding NtrC family response regulator